jgi:dTDP-4-dehydrorhamnose reductase
VRAVVIGGSGQIGGWLLQHLNARGHESVGTFATKCFPGLVQLDCSAPEASAWLIEQRPDVVFYPAGFTWVDGCERDPAKARLENMDQPLRIAMASRTVGARFVYYSTDYLFDGLDGPYSEDANPQPLNEYGRAKLNAETALAEMLGSKLLIVRTCWVYGPERQGKNFAYQVVRTLMQGKPLTCPSDQMANPSYGPDVALASLRAVELEAEGVLHIAGPEWLDRPAFARAIAAAFGLDVSLIVAHPTSELGLGAPRPLAGGLQSRRLTQLVPEVMRPLQTALADFVCCVGSGSPWANPLAAAAV